MNDDDFGPESPAFCGQLADIPRGYVGQFDAGYHPDASFFPQLSAHLNHPRHDQVNIRQVGMVGNGQGTITPVGSSSDQLRRNQFPIAEDGVGMQIDHFFFSKLFQPVFLISRSTVKTMRFFSCTFRRFLQSIRVLSKTTRQFPVVKKTFDAYSPWERFTGQ